MNSNRDVGFVIRTLSNLIKRKIDNSGAKKDVDSLTGTHGWVIGYLCHNMDHDVFQRDLEEKFSIRRSTATAILQLMVKNGLLTREPVAYDARLKKLVLTEKSMEINKMFITVVKQVEQQIVQGITAEELDAFFATAEKMKKNLEE